MANFADLTAQGTEKYTSAAAENSASVTTVQSLFFGADGRNTDTTNGIYVMLFDKGSAPVSLTDVPVICVGVPKAGTTADALSNGNWSIGAPAYGGKFVKGIQIAASSTDFPTYTAVATNKTFFHVEFGREDGMSAF